MDLQTIKENMTKPVKWNNDIYRLVGLNLLCTSEKAKEYSAGLRDPKTKTLYWVSINEVEAL